MDNKLIKDTFVLGFALFAMLFGAGNLIFPAFLGWQSGTNWTIGFICFMVIDIGLSILALVTISKKGNGAAGITENLGKKFSFVLLTIVVICIGPLIAIPRTAATTYEFAVKPIFANSSTIVSSIIFFAIVIMLSLKPTKAVDIVGSVMAPIMFVALIGLIVMGIVNPIGVIDKQCDTIRVVENATLAGYQTMDMLGMIIFSSSVLLNIKSKGYNTVNQQVKVIGASSIVCAVALCLVYGGMAYLGATSSSVFMTELSQSELVVAIVNEIMGRNGIILLGVIVAIACLTTAIGLISSSASYFVEAFDNKVSYKSLVIIFSAISCVFSNLGLTNILKLAAPLLDIIYPIFIVLIVMTMFSHKIKNKRIYAATSVVVLLFNIITMAVK